MDQIVQSLGIMLMGMCGIFIVMGIISLAISLLNKVFKK
ncbi:MAG: OadG family protein [Ruthenibacterium sp.]